MKEGSQPVYAMCESDLAHAIVRCDVILQVRKYNVNLSGGGKSVDSCPTKCLLTLSCQQSLSFLTKWV